MSGKSKILRTFIIGGALAATLATLSGCESMGRTVKNYQSDWGGGLNRILTVYGADGEVLYQQTGKFDIQESDNGNRVIYDDEDGLRHNIYLGSGTVIVHEIPE